MNIATIFINMHLLTSLFIEFLFLSFDIACTFPFFIFIYAPPFGFYYN